MKKINNWVIRTFGLRGSWSWAKKQMLNGAIIKRKATTGTYKIAIDDDKNRLLVATWDHLDQSPVWENGKWTFVKRGENFGIKLVKVLPKIHKLTLDMIAKDIFRPEKL